MTVHSIRRAMTVCKNSFGTSSILNTPDGPVVYYDLKKLQIRVSLILILFLFV